MKLVTIKLKLEKEDSREDALADFHKNIVELLNNDIDYQPEGVISETENAIFFGMKLLDDELKDVIDASPANSFEVVDVHWPDFLKKNRSEGARIVKIGQSEN